MDHNIRPRLQLPFGLPQTILWRFHGSRTEPRAASSIRQCPGVTRRCEWERVDGQSLLAARPAQTVTNSYLKAYDVELRKNYKSSADARRDAAAQRLSLANISAATTHDVTLASACIQPGPRRNRCHCGRGSKAFVPSLSRGAGTGRWARCRHLRRRSAAPEAPPRQLSAILTECVQYRGKRTFVRCKPLINIKS